MTNIRVDLDVEMAKKKISLKALSTEVGISMTNLSLLKNGKVRGIRFATLMRELTHRNGGTFVGLNDFR